MPPVRWKPLIIAMVIVLAHAVVDCDSSKLDSVSMTEDGWRPIVGSRREPTYEDEITHYRNPANKKSEAIKAEKPERKIATQPSTTAKSTSITYQGAPNLGSKIPPHSKPIILLPPHGAHGPQIPLGAMMHRPIKYGHIMKMNPYKRHKPIRMQMPAYSTRDEIFVPAPSSNLGPYAFYTQSPLKSRPPPHSHIDYSNHFGLPQDDLYQVVRAPVQQYALPPPKQHQNQNDIQQYALKHPIQNDVHYFQGNDDFTRNLVPPPFNFEKEKGVKDEVAKPSNILQQPANPFQPPVEVEVTKEKFKVFRNTVPPQIFNLQDEIEYHTLKTPKPNYEVTEGKQWQEPYHYYSTLRTPVKSRRPQPIVFTEEAKPFLPTPLKPDVAPPTLPTESEVSTIYNQIAQLNKLKEAKPTSFDIKEVSTHFPIFGNPEQQYPTKISLTDTFEINEITTRTPTTTYFAYSSSTRTPTTTTTQAPTTTFTTRKRQNQRRRRPTTPKITTTEEAEELSTELYDSQKTESEEVTEKPKQQQQHPQRRPNRFRTTTPQYEEFTTRARHRRPRPTTEADVPSNHKATYSEQPEIYDESKLQPEIRVVTEKEFPASFESHFQKNEEYEQVQHVIENFEANAPNRFYNNPPVRDEKPQKLNLQQESSTEAVTLFTPENEIDYTTRPYYHYTTELTTEATTPPTTTTTTTSTTTTTTTTEAPTTTKMHRRRPVKYDNSNRPRFSVKEYRQRLSTSTTTTPEPSKAPTYPENMRNRFPHRSRRPITTIGHAAEEEESTEPIRSKFMPKDRYNQETTTTDTQKQFKPVNTRLRPFGRYKTTTEPTSTTQKVSFKPHVFSSLRRPTPISLKTRILNKQRSTTEKPVETTQNEDETNETDMSEIIESTLPYNAPETTTEFGTRFTIDVETTTSKRDETDILKNEDFMQSQIVSELTSSAKNEYNKPGLFKNVSPTSRKVPSYFTLATDDPILPIEAFFPNLKQ